MEVIQQWQYTGAVRPEMLKDEAFLLVKETGITALQSYVPWSNIEPSQGVYDFSLYDPLVEKLEKHGLGWAPFLILGPYYATPKWFLESKESVPARCLEHDKECKIQSIWNPRLRKHVDNFLRAFHKRYGNSGALRSVLLGISGNWGESIFPVSGGFIEENHMHMGWWCGDEYALSHFRRAVEEKYRDIGTLNAAWDSNYRSFADVSFPEAGGGSAFKAALQRAWYKLSSTLPVSVRNAIKSVIIKLLRAEAEVDIDGPVRRQLDFGAWYRESMTGWEEFWLSAARKYFKTIPIYIVTGGDGHPMQGADFFAQGKAAAKYGAGVRVTSLSNNYPDSFFLSRPVVSACRFYGSYFETEEALLHDPRGIAMRIFDAATSGARGIYFKNLVGYGRDLCTGRYYSPAELTPCAKVFLESKRYLADEKPIVDIAVLYPDTAILLDYHALALLNKWSSSLREHFSFDFLNEEMIMDGALSGYKRLVALPFYVPPETEALIAEWVNKGGMRIRLKNGHDLNGLKQRGVVSGLMPSRVYEARVEGGIYLYNSGNKPQKAKIRGKELLLPPRSIAKMDL